MDHQIIKRLILGKLCDPGTYILAAIVGLCINLYGQLLVPWLRGSESPLSDLITGLQNYPATTLISIFLGFAFPFCVGVYSSVSTRYKLRRVESIADFPERKPDPVFRVSRNGELLEAGKLTRLLFDQHEITHAVQILGKDIWSRIQLDRGVDPSTTITFAPEQCRYTVAYVPTGNNNINIYLTSLGPY